VDRWVHSQDEGHGGVDEQFTRPRASREKRQQPKRASASH
jgi:hypothetical protein